MSHDNTPNPNEDWEGDPEVHRFSLEPDSPLFNRLCNPTGNLPPVLSLELGDGIASYDNSFTAPYCQGKNEKCDSSTLLEDRAIEGNTPNTIDDCTDGKNATDAYPESVTHVVVESVKGNLLRGGELVKIKANVKAFSNKDRVDFYYTADATSSPPKWIFITTVAVPSAGDFAVNENIINAGIEFTLPKCTDEAGCKQAVRVALRSSRNPTNTANTLGNKDGNHKPNVDCAKDPFDDTDDLVRTQVYRIIVMFLLNGFVLNNLFFNF